MNAREVPIPSLRERESSLHAEVGGAAKPRPSWLRSASDTLSAWRVPSLGVVLVCDECGAGFVHPDRAWALHGPDFNSEVDDEFKEADDATGSDIDAMGWPRRWFFFPSDTR
jgi:hypothetical protein